MSFEKSIYSRRRFVCEYNCRKTLDTFYKLLLPIPELKYTDDSTYFETHTSEEVCKTLGQQPYPLIQNQKLFSCTDIFLEYAQTCCQ